MSSYLNTAPSANVTPIANREKAGMWGNARLNLVDGEGKVVETVKIGSIPFYASSEVGKMLIERLLKGTDAEKLEAAQKFAQAIVWDFQNGEPKAVKGKLSF